VLAITLWHRVRAKRPVLAASGGSVAIDVNFPVVEGLRLAGFDQDLRVRVQRCPVYRVGRRIFDDLSSVHDDDAIADAGYDIDVVRHEDQCHISVQ
jgi:hypothetical protein